MNDQSKRIFALLLSFVMSNNAFADTNLATITSDTLKAIPHCLHYKIKGVCYWKDTYGINTTTYVEHYLPDVVVSIFNKPDENPWTEINLSIDKAGKAAQKQIVSSFSGFDVGSRQHSVSDEHEQNVFLMKLI